MGQAAGLTRRRQPRGGGLNRAYALLEDGFLVLWRDTDPGVADRDLDSWPPDHAS